MAGPQIDPRLLVRLVERLGFSRAHVYHLIEEKSRTLNLPKQVAAFALARDHKISISRLASNEELALLRQSTLSTPIYAGETNSSASRSSGPVPRRAVRAKTARRRSGTSVFVVHGRNTRLLKDLHAFLRAIGLRPIDWHKALEMTKKPTPYVGQVLDTAFSKATATVVLLTADDEARLRSALRGAHDSQENGRLQGQPRANVIFEAGMAFARMPDSTVFVQIGAIRPFTDIAGLHVVRLDNSPAKRKELVMKLRSAKCDVDDSGTDWYEVGDFTS